MTYDDLVQHLGQFGRYQRKVYILVCLPMICCAFHKLCGSFLVPKLNFRCLLPFENAENVTYEPQYNIDAYYPPASGKEKLKRCEMFPSNSSGGINPHAKPIPCDQYVYDRKTYKSSVTSEWNVVCEKDTIKVIGDSLFMFGVMLGSIFFSYFSDKYGRRPVFFLSLVIQLIGGGLTVISPGYIYFLVFRMIVGASTSGVFLVAYVIALEMVGPEKRATAGLGCELFFCAGYNLTGIFSYFIRDWRILQLVLTAPSLVFLLYSWFIPESGRWLLAKGRVQEAKELLQFAAKKSDVELTDEMFHSLLAKNSEQSTPDEKKPSVFDLLRFPNLRRKSALLCFNWLVVSGTYYGLSFSASSLGGDDHLNYLLSGLVEIPTYTFLIFMFNKWGRKKILCGSMVPAGIFLMLTAFESKWSKITFFMLGKLMISASYATIYIFSVEQFPTAVRNIGLGTCSTSGRIGGILAPVVNNISKTLEWLPYGIYGLCALIGGLLSLLLPETLNQQTMETVQDGELFGRKIKKKNAEKSVHVIDGKRVPDEETKM